MKMESAGAGKGAIRRMAAIACTAAALSLLAGCDGGGGSDNPSFLLCDASLGAQLRPDANTSVLLVRPFK